MYLPYFFWIISIVDSVKEPCGDSQKGARKHDLLLLLSLFLLLYSRFLHPAFRDVSILIWRFMNSETLLNDPLVVSRSMMSEASFNWRIKGKRSNMKINKDEKIKNERGNPLIERLRKKGQIIVYRGQVLRIVKTMHAFNRCSIECNELAFSLLIFINSNKSLVLLICNYSAPLFPKAIIYCTCCSLLLIKTNSHKNRLSHICYHNFEVLQLCDNTWRPIWISKKILLQLKIWKWRVSPEYN